ncbi:dipeptidase PepV [Clostridium aminobutyricum]|uniref:Dipeptidase PepV n=1 Tax=Clostridium aminobutyricum TaxID=33953 RepID=A0A939DB22_CLOAM|nr:dipeptidase PepV [Clostridium aminobutyricum]MBN7774322.1 dipeptidase PepV [Clostridium aminobutyricum]
MGNYLELIDQYKDQMLRDLQEIVAIKSVAGEPEGDSPFGKGVQDALDAMLAIGEREGFAAKNVDNYGGHLEFKGDGDGIFALVGHLDVVPEGSGWVHEPYGGEIVGDKMFGRGTIDDKGPTMAAFYAMKALKDSGFKPRKDIRLILGLDEETDWDGMKYYMAHEEIPDSGFAPDADFPVIYCEKGLIVFDVMKSLHNVNASGLRLVRFEGGNAPNMVADRAKLVVTGGDISDKIAEYKKNSGYDITCERVEDCLEISAKGISAHGAMPEVGLSAITILFDAVKDIEFNNSEVNAFIKFYNDTIGFDYHGERFGCAFEDEPSGKLNFNVGLFKLDETEARLTINIRYPATMDVEDVYLGMETVVGPTGYSIERKDHLAPLYVPKDHALVKVLMEVYQEFTGDKESEPLAIGGATYARTVPNSVAFGPVFPGEEAVEHQADEYISISGMIKATKIFAEAIYRWTK